MIQKVFISQGEKHPRVGRWAFWGITRKREFRFSIRAFVDHYDGESYLCWKLGGLAYAGLFRWERIRRNGWGQWASGDHEDSDRVVIRATIKDGIKGVNVIWYAYRRGAGAITPKEERPEIIRENSGYLGGNYEPIFIPSGESFVVGCRMYNDRTEYWCIDETGRYVDHVAPREKKLSWFRYRCWAAANNGPKSPGAEQDIRFNYYT